MQLSDPIRAGFFTERGARELSYVVESSNPGGDHGRGTSVQASASGRAHPSALNGHRDH
jgi:hypothetical protein